MAQNISIQEYYKIILYLYQLKNALNILMALLGFIHGNLMDFCRSSWIIKHKF